MIVRTCVLSACMVVVPGLALCSHHVPQELRAATRAAIWEPLVARVEGWWSPPVDDSATASESVHQEPIASPAAPPAPPPASPAAPPVAATDHGRLIALGALAIECRPLESTSGVHVASCRLAMDAAGQLQRVFQAAGPTPAAAMAALVEQVVAWRERLVARAGEHPPTTGPR